MQKVTLTPREIVLPGASTLDAGILEAYNEGIKSYRGKARQTLDVFSDKKGELAGSNCFAPLKLREYFSNETRLATMVDLGRATEINPIFISGLYSDTGLDLRTAGDSYTDNDFLAKDLAEQLKKRNISLDIPKVIYFDALNLREDDDSRYGLAYDLNERAKLGENIIDAPELVRDFRFKIMNEKGIPIEDEKGTRTSYTRQDGLSGFCLNWDSSVNSFNRNLADSNGDGRVVVVSALGANAQRMEEYLGNLKKEHKRQLSELDERYKKSLKDLRGE